MQYALRDLPLLAELPTATLADLSTLARHLRYPAGQIRFWER